MNTTTLLPLEKKDDVDVDVELSYQKTNTIAITTKHNKNENKRINKMILFGGIAAMIVGGAIVVATSNGNLLADTTNGDNIDGAISSYKSSTNCGASNTGHYKKPWSGESNYNAIEGRSQTCWKNGPNDWQGLCYSNVGIINRSLRPCKPKGGQWQPIANNKLNPKYCGTQCTSFVDDGSW